MVHCVCIGGYLYTRALGQIVFFFASPKSKQLVNFVHLKKVWCDFEDKNRRTAKNI